MVSVYVCGITMLKNLFEKLSNKISPDIVTQLFKIIHRPYCEKLCVGTSFFLPYFLYESCRGHFFSSKLSCLQHLRVFWAAVPWILKAEQGILLLLVALKLNGRGNAVISTDDTSKTSKVFNKMQMN